MRLSKTVVDRVYKRNWDKEWAIARAMESGINEIPMVVERILKRSRMLMERVFPTIMRDVKYVKIKDFSPRVNLRTEEILYKLSGGALKTLDKIEEDAKTIVKLVAKIKKEDKILFKIDKALLEKGMQEVVANKKQLKKRLERVDEQRKVLGKAGLLS